jgi:hypothetical protein
MHCEKAGSVATPAWSPMAWMPDNGGAESYHGAPESTAESTDGSL